ncbi:BRD7 protein, partial [Tichodroma muraria]|nr:BRD7 protein [Tichodroma muraria]
EYVEKPLKLVLKVGGNEVAELSTGNAGLDSSLYEDKSEHEKHKDRKRKKRKKGEKQVPGFAGALTFPLQTFQEDKKKRDRDHGDSEGEQEMKCQTPVRMELSPEKPLTSTLSKQEVLPHTLSPPLVFGLEVEQTPLQEALNQLMRQLQRKDPSSFFSFPVTDFIAPGYSMIIKNPMDFSTMKEKIKNNGYQSIEELKDNFKLMCNNAMIYNKPDTVYYKAAKKLLHSGMKILSQERIQSLKQSIEFMADLQKTRKQKDKTELQQTGEEENGPGKDRGEPVDGDTKAFKTPSKEHKNLVIFLWLLCFCILVCPVAEPGYCPVKLGMTAGRLQSGVNTLQGFKEDKRNKVTPVTYLNYGPFSSYAPTYDSTFANISKEDSDLIYSTYGEDSNQGS